MPIKRPSVAVSQTLWRLKTAVRPLRWPIYRRLGVVPMQRVMTKLRERHVSLGDLSALELFGGTCDPFDYVGVCHVKDYIDEVSSVEVWEINLENATKLRRNLPRADVKHVDSHSEIATTPKKYSLIVSDNPDSAYSDYCEHFDLFPHIFRIAMDSTILILNVIPPMDDAELRKHPWTFNPIHRERRKAFYRTERPDRVTLAEMLMVYKDLITRNGFELEWHFLQRRRITLDTVLGSNFPLLYYLVLKIKKARM